MSAADGLVCAVSTVKDTLPRLQQYVARNLAGGVDHLFVFLDAGDREVRTWLEAHPHVTCVRTDKEWWRGERPSQLNDRQRLNANAVNVVLGELGWADWLFHVDGDEVVQADRAVLARVPAETRAVRLGVREAVSQVHWEEPPTWFKRPLEEPELVLLTQLGAIDRPSNGAYLHGHADGKTGIRPGAGAWLTLHDPVDDEGRAVPEALDEALRVLHYESYSGEEFARKWLALLGAGPGTRFRPGRQPTLVAVQALVERQLPPDVTERYLLRIFEQTIADDLEVLRDLGLVERIDPDHGSHTPKALSDAQRADLAAALARAAATPKERFRPPATRPVDRGEDAEPPARAGRFLRRS
ncbi:MAG TPA: glycosyltransferase family 2 protein [Nocardioides sp.]|nr:glycosyltransferase family 2 protein [Nocardioides sp.]